MTYFAVAAVRTGTKWTAHELDFDGVEDIDEVADRLRDVADDADVSLAFVEADDEYLTVLRLDDGEDLRLFSSDAEFADSSRLGGILLADVTDGEPVEMDADPVGESDLLADLGVSSDALLALCAKDGMLPSDVTAEVASGLGIVDDIEELREP
ncbi:tRNA adenosine deaminase-associated protein [Phytomonospora sp. NPDC050363]|uniref:tRNA adenosine deaminase-associated protein n=1 Tax=Phytomonospora sp. NPDC050363 TaxID=3155642 RepID=UPI0034107A67